MKERSLRIELKNPCSQNWDAMPRVNGGLYCSQCTKVVTDFTGMSDEELIQFLSKKNASESCGKFYRGQLEKVYILQTTKPVTSYHGLKLLLAGLLTLRLPLEAQSLSTQKEAVLKTDQKTPAGKSRVPGKVIKGKVINRTSHSGIPVSIVVYTDKSGGDPISTLFTDSLGHYELALPDSGLHKFFKLVYSAENYLERSIVVDRDKIPAYLTVSLLPLTTVEIVTTEVYGRNDYQTMGGVPLQNYRYEEVSGGPSVMIETVRQPFHKRIWGRLKWFFRRTFAKSNKV